MVLATGSIVLFALAPNYAILLFANTLWAFAITFISGADKALFYDTLRVLGRESEYPKFRGWLAAVVMDSTAASSALGGFIGEFNLTATFLLPSVLMVIAFVFLLWLKETPMEADPLTGRKLSYRETLQTAFGAIRQNVGLRYALIYSSMLYLMPVAIRVTFIQPHVIAIGLPIASLGVIGLVIRLFQVAGSAYAGNIAARFGEWRLMVLSPLLIFLGLAAIGGIESWVGIALFAPTGFFSAATTPTIESVVNRQVPGSVRATILSVDSMIFRLLTVILSPGVGLTADLYGLPAAFRWMALVYVLLMLVLMVFWGRMRKGSEKTEGIGPFDQNHAH